MHAEPAITKYDPDSKYHCGVCYASGNQAHSAYCESTRPNYVKVEK